MPNQSVFLSNDENNDEIGFENNKYNSRIPRKKIRPKFITTYAVFYLFSAISGLCGLFPVFLTFSSWETYYGSAIIVIIMLQIIFTAAIGIGLWKMLSWSWWMITALHPFSIGLNFTFSYLFIKDFTKIITTLEEIPLEFQSLQTNNFIIFILGFVISFLYITIIQLLFWGNRDSFFNAKDKPMTLGEFGLMQLVAILFGVVVSISIYLILQKNGVLIDSIFTDLINQTY